MRNLFLSTVLLAMPAGALMAQQGDPVALATAANICGPVGVSDAQYRPDGRIAVVCNPGGPPAGTTGPVAATAAGVGPAAAGVGLAVVAALIGSDSDTTTGTD